MAIVGCAPGPAFGQLQRITTEPVPGAILNAPNFVVDSVHFGAIDERTLLGEDRDRDLSGSIPRFAVAEPADYTPDQFGSIQLLASGRIAWRLDIQADGAHSINIGTEFDVPDSLEMYLLNAEGRTLWGALTSRDSFQGQMWSPIVPGEVMRIYAEMDEADWDRFVAGFRITSVNIGYRGIGGAIHAADATTRSDACQTDVACREADPWCAQVKGTICYTIDGTGVCSGSILNNTGVDGRPLLYTAYHCHSQDNPAGLRVYFNFQNATCRRPGSAESAGPGTCDDISFGGMPCDTQTIQGASVVAMQQDADAVLLELSSTPPDSFEVVYLGWNASGTLPAPAPGSPSAVGIHHPGVEEKRIAFEEDPYIGQELISIGFSVNSWAVDFDNGGLEPGSSGSPLFDANGRVIGAVSGADQVSRVCDQSQRYGRLEHAWHTNAAFRQALDPVGAGTIDQLDLASFFPAGAPEAFGFDLVSPADGTTLIDTGPNLVWNGACFAESYRLRVSTSPDLADPIVDLIVQAPTTSVDLDDASLALDTEYYWRVDAANAAGTTNSSTFSFRAPPVPDPSAPGPFALVSPGVGLTDVETGPVLDWEDAPNAQTYLIEVDDDIAFATPVVGVVVSATLRASELALPAGTLQFNTPYFWRVTALNSAGSTPASPSVSGFLTRMAPPCPCRGDLDGDCDEDVFDFGAFLTSFGSTVPPGTGADLDANGTVDVFDLAVFAAGFGCSVY